MSRDSMGSWLFLLFNLPAKQSSDRVKTWRHLKKSGAIQLKTSTYVLPDEPVHYERFQHLAKAIVACGGEATLVRRQPRFKERDVFAGRRPSRQSVPCRA